MKKIIVVAGGTGKLGTKIIDALLKEGATVRMIVRKGTDPSKLEPFKIKSVEAIEIDMLNSAEVSHACAGASCIVSALQGLADVIIDVQTALLIGGIAAGVKRFIPSDYSLDFTELPAGTNRNFDLRRDFHKVLNATPVAATSILNGAFAEILYYSTPMLNFKQGSVGYWGDNPDWKLDFTTMDDTAAYTAKAAMDDESPRSLHIAGFQVSPRQLATIAKDITSKEFSLVRIGSLENLKEYFEKEGKAHPETEAEIFPRWQQSQYMHDQFSTHHEKLDNDRYSGIDWIGAEAFLGKVLSN